jgi:hypothetical protein
VAIYLRVSWNSIHSRSHHNPRRVSISTRSKTSTNVSLFQPQHFLPWPTKFPLQRRNTAPKQEQTNENAVEKRGVSKQKEGFKKKKTIRWMIVLGITYLVLVLVLLLKGTEITTGTTTAVSTLTRQSESG